MLLYNKKKRNKLKMENTNNSSNTNNNTITPLTPLTPPNPLNFNAVTSAMNTGIMALVIACVFISFLLNCIYSTRFSNYLRNNNNNTAQLQDKSLLNRINDIQICSWFFLATPILNIGLASGLAHNVNQLP